MSNPSIIIDPNEARDIEKNLILREIYYRPTGYFSNAKTLRDECKKWVAVLNIVDISSRFKASWVKYLPEVIDYLNNYPTRLIRAPGSSKWGLAPIKAIKLEKVESRPSTKYKRPVGKNEENKLKKGDSVRYLLANAEWEGGMENQKRATDPTFNSVSSSNHDPLGLHPLALPELLTEILSYLAEDKTFIPDFIYVKSLVEPYIGLEDCVRTCASKPHHIKDKTICGIASLCPNLTYLYLGYSNNISDISVIEIAKSCKKIEYINIGGSGITDVSLKEIAHLCPNLRHLHLSNCEKITDDGICAIAISHPNMLSFSFADEEGKFDMDNIAVSDTSVRIIADSCPKLQYLNVSWRHISDESICVIAQLCPELEQLYLEGCDITDKSMSALANLCNLQKLVIADCDEISMNAIITLQNKNPTLNIFGWYSDTNSESDTDGVIQKADPVEKFVLNIDEYVNPERLTH
ncbi:3121_t:CDS:2 [Entrophospora sp. SA101]|nr:3121_t:CDS:2 [Entrophospora sp. SA101]